MINFTLIVQVIHFWIAYWILSRIFFKPAYEIIMADEQQAAALEKQINRVENAISEQTSSNKREWVQLQRDLQKQVPQVRHEIVKAEIREKEQQVEPLSEAQTQALVAQMRDLVVNRVSNGTC